MTFKDEVQKCAAAKVDFGNAAADIEEIGTTLGNLAYLFGLKVARTISQELQLCGYGHVEVDYSNGQWMVFGATSEDGSFLGQEDMDAVSMFLTNFTESRCGRLDSKVCAVVVFNAMTNHSFFDTPEV